MTEVIRFDFLQSALEPYRNLLATIDRTGASGITFDLMLTPVKGDGKPDSLLMEISRGQAYGIVDIKEGVTVHEGSGQSFLLSTTAFGGFPYNPVADKPIQLKVSDRVYGVYPDDGIMEDVKFEVEYSDNPAMFQRKENAALMLGFNADAQKVFGTFIESASNYVYKKRTDEPFSVIKVGFKKDGNCTIESTTGMEAFYAETKIEGLIPLQQDLEIECLLHPALWQAGMTLGARTKLDLYMGYNASTITFVSGNIGFSHTMMNFTEYPAIGAEIKNWVANNPNDAFHAIINPESLQSKLKYLESIGMAAKAQEPAFILSNKNGTPHIKLKGFSSSGEAKIVDRNILNIAWNRDAEIKLPARLMLSLLSTATTHALTEFFDLQNVPSIFLVNSQRTCFILMSQDAPEGA